MKPKKTDNETPEKLSTTEARQARPGFNFRVLVISIIALTIAFVAAYMFSEATDVDDPAPNQSETESVTDIEPPPNVPPADFAD